MTSGDVSAAPIKQVRLTAAASGKNIATSSFGSEVFHLVQMNKKPEVMQAVRVEDADVRHVLLADNCMARQRQWMIKSRARVYVPLTRLHWPLPGTPAGLEPSRRPLGPTVATD